MDQVLLVDKMMDTLVGVVTPPEELSDRPRISDKLA